MPRSRFERTENYLVTLIVRPGADQGQRWRIRVLLWMLKQLSRVYRAVIQLRLFLFAKRILRHHTLGCQVISVGNLTVGGTGKTPVVEIFARELQRAGRRVAILSRGYKKVEPSFWQKIWRRITFAGHREPPRVVSDGRKLLLDSAMSGDEPYMLASNLPAVAVLVDKNRVKSGRYAINRLGCDTLVLDDGFQYLHLKHRIHIVLVDRTNPFGNEYCLPRGILREPVKNLKRADYIFITKSDGRDVEPLRQRIRTLNAHAEIIECRHCPRHLQSVFADERVELAWLGGKRVCALSGIAAPLGFERSIEAFGAELVERHRFADHHRYTEQEILDVINACSRGGMDAIVTTEKDAVRFPRLRRVDVPVYYLRVDIEILKGAEDFHECIARICFRDGASAARAGVTAV